METATLTCPNCKSKQEQLIPQNKSIVLYDCKSCAVQNLAKNGDCCVICSYGDKRCPVTVKKDAA